MAEKTPVHLCHWGLSSDRRTNRWRVTCGNCKCDFDPRTTMLIHQDFDCPKCGALHRANWNDETVFHIKEDRP